jgi:hypothetical protein
MELEKIKLVACLLWVEKIIEEETKALGTPGIGPLPAGMHHGKTSFYRC